MNKPVPILLSYEGRGTRYGRYKCVCGNEFVTRTHYVNSGGTVSCGCYKRSILGGHGKHGESVHASGGITKEYRAWIQMKRRCYNPNAEQYPHYGGRGIKLCDRWLGDDGYHNFLADMGRAPSARHSVDRKDVNGNYDPTNCRWATPREQGNNKRNNLRVTIRGETKSVTDWSRSLGSRAGAITLRIRNGWDPVRAVLMPVGRKGRRTAAQIAEVRTPLQLL